MGEKIARRRDKAERAGQWFGIGSPEHAAATVLCFCFLLSCKFDPDGSR